MSRKNAPFSGKQLRSRLLEVNRLIRPEILGARPRLSASQIVSTLTAPATAGPQEQALPCYLDPQAARAAKLLATEIDTHIDEMAEFYHNVPHYLGVALTAFVYGQWEQRKPSAILRRNKVVLTQEDVSDCLIAGLLHDIYHPGGNNHDVPYLLEGRSWERAETFLRQAGYSDERCQRLKWMVMGTDPVFGVPAVELAMDYHMADAADRPAILQKIENLKHEEKNKNNLALHDLIAAHLHDPKLAIMSYLLTKGDIFFSTMPETAFPNTVALEDEFTAYNVNIQFFDEAGKILTDKVDYFFGELVGLKAPFKLDSVRSIAEKEARRAWKQLLSPRMAWRIPKRAVAHSGVGQLQNPTVL